MEPSTTGGSELTTLREQLQDAEDVCHAIRMGEVDAVVVGRDDEDKRVLLMSGAYARYRQIVEDIIQGAVTVSPGGEILFANHAFARMVGENLADVLRTPLQRWVLPEQAAQVAAAAKGSLSQRDIGVELQRGARDPLPVTLSLVSSSDDFTTLLVTPVQAQDAEDARATLEAIRSGSVDAFVVDGKQVRMLDSAQAPYRVLVEQMRQGAATVDADGTIVYANERLVTMLAMPAARLLGTKLAQHVAEPDRHALRTMLAARANAQADLRLLRANGDPTAVQATMTSLDGHKLFLFTDVSERKRHEASDERTRRFLGMLAHEFRNMLGPISTSTEVLKRSATLDADGRKAVETIERQAARLVGLVEDLRRVNPKE
ncbi:MAG TPA: PAS domain-containing protein [Burkholderiales bacterium]|nr:PAS domain-containing protein [Burkholderiales bacterium]